MLYQNLSDAQLELETKKSAFEETKIQTKMLHLLAEIERRRLYSKSYPSLFEYCVKNLKLSCGSAQRRIDTMRAMKLMPEIESKLMTGELNLSTVSKAQTFFRQEKKLRKSYSVPEKKELLKKLENKSSIECSKELVAISPQAMIQERRRDLNPTMTELRMTVDQELLGKLDQLKALWSHQNPTMTDLELFQKMADFCLKKVDPLQKKIKKIPIPLAAVNPRFISAKLKQQVWVRDQGTCTFPGCQTKHFLEYDHIQPVSQKGMSTLDNLRLLCRAHNQHMAIQKLGFPRMNRFLN